MPALGFVIPILPGKTEADRSAMTSCWRGERQADYEKSRKRSGITREAVWIQATPAGDVAVIYVESDDVEAAYKDMASSQEPFDGWFREYVLDVHGIDLQDGLAPAEQVMDYRA
ncbi:MAG: hypothetical protein M3446_05145 [Actinomycetota bacterium]|nr:hypothetical protein [Actinomycetota bacterium]